MSRPVPFKFRLYVAGDTPNSLKAVANLKALCRTYLPGRHEIEIVDVFREPNRALTERILMTPTLVKLSPAPACTIIGTLSRADSLLQALGLETIAT
jgi:circadian clock protein KaiB